MQRTILPKFYFAGLWCYYYRAPRQQVVAERYHGPIAQPSRIAWLGSHGLVQVCPRHTVRLFPAIGLGATKPLLVRLMSLPKSDLGAAKAGAPSEWRTAAVEHRRRK